LHLEELRQATTKWLQWENAKDDNARELLLINSSLENTGKPEPPEVLSYMREAKKLGVPIHTGTLWALPYIFRLEMNVCLDVEQEQFEILQANIRLAAEFLDGQAK